MDLRVTIKFLKAEPSDGPAVRLRGGETVSQRDDPLYSVDNRFETILCLIVPNDVSQILDFDLYVPVRRVVLGFKDLPFETHEDRVRITLPPLSVHTDRTADMHMIVPSKGVELRVEVPNTLQAGGKYGSNDYPHKARQAATTLEFALLEAVQLLGLGETIGQGPCGPIYIMGFDTNNPCGHTDWPPHVHLHMARPALGAPIGHYYFDKDLLLSHNVMYYRGSDEPTGTFRVGEHCPHLAPDGSVLFDLMITSNGGLHLADLEGRAAQIEALPGGFNQGAQISVGAKQILVKVEPDNCSGEVAVSRDGVITRYVYDQDTGQFLSRSDSMPTLESSQVPA